MQRIPDQVLASLCRYVVQLCKNEKIFIAAEAPVGREELGNITYHAPDSTQNVIESTAVKLPNFFVRFLTSKIVLLINRLPYFSHCA